MAKDLKTNVDRLRKHWKTSGGKPLSFGSKYKNINDVFANACLNAYGPSVIRTGNLTGASKKTKQFLKNYVADYLKEKIKDIYCRKSLDYEDFCEWEYENVKWVRSTYHNNGVKNYTYGNAQKLINMAIKYLLSSNLIDENNPLFKECYFPVDSIIQKKLHKDFSIPYLPNKNHSWSKNDNWNDFMSYQDNAREIILKNSYYSPLICEISEW